MNWAVNLTKRVKTARGLRYCAVARFANGRVKPDIVLLNGIEERHPEGAYYLEWRETGKSVRLSVGPDALEAYTRCLRKAAELHALNNDLALIRPKATRLVAATIADFLDETKLSKKPKTFAAYSLALRYFQESCPKLCLEEIDRDDLMAFAAFLRDKKHLAPRSCSNKFADVISFLKGYGIRGLVGKKDWPRYVEEEPEIYEREELDTLFAACDAEERLWYEFFLMTGMREQEAMYCSWEDVNLAHATVRVSHKPDRGWTPKAYKEREIPIPAKLVEKLKTAKANADDTCSLASSSGLVFPTSGGQPKLNFLDGLKVVAQRANLDPARVYLHKFRATFATWSLRSGVDLRTVQYWLGHSDIESTMRYLKPSRSRQTQQKVNEIFALSM